MKIIPEEFNIVTKEPVLPSREFCGRLIEFYRRQAPPVVTEIWSDIADTFHEALRIPLVNSDYSMLASSLCSAYTNKLVYGLDNWNWEDIQTYRACWLDALTRLAYATGAIHVHNDEQPDDSLIGALGAIVAIEQNAYIKIGCKGGGSVQGCSIGGRFIPRKLLDALTALSVVNSFGYKQAALEIGPGVGFLCLAAMQQNKFAQYHTVDNMPIVAVLFAYLMSVEFGQDAIWLNGEEVKDKHRIFVHGTNTDHVPNVDTAINQDSLPEMPQNVQEIYFNLIASKLSGHFISINHESTIAGQTSVIDAIVNCAKFKRVMRSPYWGRNCYVAEAWQLAK